MSPSNLFHDRIGSLGDSEHTPFALYREAWIVPENLLTLFEVGPDSPKSPITERILLIHKR